jgi:hypothetical protein
VADALNVLVEGEKLASGGQVEGGSGWGVLSCKDAAELHETTGAASRTACGGRTAAVCKGGRVAGRGSGASEAGGRPEGAHAAADNQEPLKMAVRSLRRTGTLYGGAYTAGKCGGCGRSCGGEGLQPVRQKEVQW